MRTSDHGFFMSVLNRLPGCPGQTIQEARVKAIIRSGAAKLTLADETGLQTLPMDTDLPRPADGPSHEGLLAWG